MCYFAHVDKCEVAEERVALQRGPLHQIVPVELPDLGQRKDRHRKIEVGLNLYVCKDIHDAAVLQKVAYAKPCKLMEM